MLKVMIAPVTPFQQNCSLVWCDETMEGTAVDPGGDFDMLKQAISEQGIKITKVLLKPFMDVAGDHAHNDMAGDGQDSMKSVLTKNGFHVIVVIEGMGEQDGFADIFVDHLAETSNDYGITLE